MDESEDEILAKNRGSSQHKKNKRPVTDLGTHNNMHSLSSDDSEKLPLPVHKKQGVFARRYSPMQNE